ncbi:MAG: DNA-processing protein DprA [Clostridia bacterium]|nr:DNA-processing protein DprA [Clostridia bacterium]
MYSKQEKALIALSLVDGIGPKRMSKLLSMVDEPHEIMQADDSLIKKIIGEKAYKNYGNVVRSSMVEDHIANVEKMGIRMICRFTDAYPSQLEEIFDPPYVLYIKGSLESIPTDKLLGSVGSRAPTRYGQQTAYSICKEAARQGVTVVSGMARGIDTCSHTGALDGGGTTIAVLGSGVDICYPPENIELYDRIMSSGLVISEYRPGASPIANHFRSRNRIIAGLSHAVLVAEADKGSGSKITVDYALDYSREIFAVPGPINSQLSYTPNHLIRDGAHMVLEPGDLLYEMNWAVKRTADVSFKNLSVTLSDEEAEIVRPLMNEELSFEELSEKTGYSPDKLNSLLTMLQLRGIIKQHSGRIYSI